MRLSKKKATMLRQALATWRDEGVLEEDDVTFLDRNIDVAAFDWRRLARYSMRIAIACIVISVGSIIADEALLRLLERLFDLPHLTQAFIFSALAALFFWIGMRRRAFTPERVYTNETFFFLGVLSVAVAIAFLGAALSEVSNHFTLLLLLASVIYAVLGALFPSTLVWVFGLASMGGWFGAETGYISGWGSYYCGMNYPMRFVLFGILLTATGYAFQKSPYLTFLENSTRAMGFLYLFVALWILSIFGNYGDMEQWYEAKQMELFHWSVLFGIAAGGTIYLGLRNDDGLARGFGITFLLINLYTRFFEHFWDAMHKAIFFAILAATFWFIGSRAETIWTLGGVVGTARRNDTGDDDA
jgi:hypothetical protein